MQGKAVVARPVIIASLDDDIVNTDGRRVFARVQLYRKDGVYHARLTGPQGSNVLTSMSKANGLAVCHEDMPIIKAGSPVSVQMLYRDEEIF
jgi:molybdopterin molybdotransferase